MIEEILKPSLKFEGRDESGKFIDLFKNLYRLPLFKDPMDLILTMVKNRQLRFEVKIIKSWDTNVGCYLRDQNKIYNKFLKTFTKKLDHLIIIRNLTTSVISHEMAHALEVESGLVLNEDFRAAIGFDMKDRQADNIVLRSSIKRIMIDGLKPYPKHQIISELFARYFELLSISRDIEPNGGFLGSEAIGFFANTSKYVQEIFNKEIKSKISNQIAEYTIGFGYEDGQDSTKKFVHQVNSFHKKLDSQGNKVWSGNVRSNSAWQQDWDNHQKQLENK